MAFGQDGALLTDDYFLPAVLNCSKLSTQDDSPA